MKITFVVHQFPLRYFTGTESYAFALARGLRAAGVDVDVFTLDPAFGEATGPWREQEEVVSGIPVRRVNYWMVLHRDFARLEYQHPMMDVSFRRHLETRRPDLVHIFHLRHLGVGLIDVAKALSIPVVVHLMDFWFLCPAVILMRRDGALCQGPPEGGAGCIPCIAPELADTMAASLIGDELRATLRSPDDKAGQGACRPTVAARTRTYLDRPAVLRRALQSAALVLAPSRFLMNQFAANGCADLPIRLAPYGVDRDRLKGLVETRADRSGAGDRSALVFGFIGSIAPHKGLHVLLEAFAGVEGPARLQIHGRTNDFAEYADPLIEATATDRRITFEGPFPFEDLGSVLSRIDILVVPSLWYENTPFVLLEAFAAGVPVVATDLGGLSEIVADQRTGDLFPRGDVLSLRSKLQRLLDEPDRRARYRAAIPAPRMLDQDVSSLKAHYQDLLSVSGAREC